ncbi:hypothetical protein ASU31_07305 [Pedobacter ginsenosidimutans]|uniref:Uncharacterized protein n=1 Tax=Pedobacter ginsenosidimutans TaxID=687842 RepID=A0A0T5VSJ9_9SPHI|nr:hypothetical protein ASU31_07305 [Pedobacter ginsenosidimutans]
MGFLAVNKIKQLNVQKQKKNILRKIDAKTIILPLFFYDLAPYFLISLRISLLTSMSILKLKLCL